MHIGIDLGTTNSLIAAWHDGKPRVIPNALGDVLTPSVVGLDDDGDILVGAAARDRLVSHPHLTAARFKRYMGTAKTATLGDREFRPEELSSFVLRSLKRDAEIEIGESITEAIITVPAYFNDAQRKATRAAAQLAGIRAERLLNEPTAASLAYGLHQTESSGQFLVVDLGGGTFDVSLLEYFDGVMEVRASAGDNYLGGDDFVELLVAHFLEGHNDPIDVLRDGARFWQKRAREQQGLLAEQVVWREAERVKRELTVQEVSTFEVAIAGKTYQSEITRATFEKLSDQLITRIKRPIEKALRDARIRPDELTEIVTVGGATRMPMIRKAVSLMFGRLPQSGIDPDEIVGVGAAVQAGLKARDAALDDVVMTDVCPYTLGIEVTQQVVGGALAGGVYHPIIERNSVIPISRSDVFSTVHNGQTEIEVRVYQGESAMVKENILLGALQVAVPPAPAGAESVEIRFTYDIDGLLEVETKVFSTGETYSTIIYDNPNLLSDQEIAARTSALANLKIHPRENSENRALIARLERMHEEHLGEAREQIKNCLIEFINVLERQNTEEIDHAKKVIVEVISQLERSDPF